MRVVVRSKTYTVQLQILLVQGAPKFGMRVVEAKLAELDRTLDVFLVAHPEAKPANQRFGLRVYPISKTPFVLYDFDDGELRVHFVFHRSADLSGLDPASAEW